MMATVAHRLPRVAGSPSSENDVRMSWAQPEASFTPGGTALRAMLSASCGARPACDGSVVVWQPASRAARARAATGGRRFGVIIVRKRSM